MPMLNGGGSIGGWGLTGRVESHQSETPYVGERKKTIGTFRLDYEYEIEYEYNFSILVFGLHIITTHTHFIP